MENEKLNAAELVPWTHSESDPIGSLIALWHNGSRYGFSFTHLWLGENAMDLLFKNEKTKRRMKSHGLAATSGSPDAVERLLVAEMGSSFEGEISVEVSPSGDLVAWTNKTQHAELNGIV